jgi:hypothetical protein
MGSIECRDLFDDDGRSEWVSCGPQVRIPETVLEQLRRYFTSSFEDGAAAADVMCLTDFPPDFDPWTQSVEELKITNRQFLKCLSTSLTFPESGSELSWMVPSPPGELADKIYRLIAALRDAIEENQHKATGTF